MEKILIIACKRMMDDYCIACSRCMVAFNRREGQFTEYKDKDAELIGILGCGDCPGGSIVPRLVGVNLWNKPLNEKVTKVHVGTCIMRGCPYKDTIIRQIKDTAGVEVIEGGHAYVPNNIFSK
jgi:predicted metal-binding protein